MLWFSRLFCCGGKYSFEKQISSFANISICHYRSPGGCLIAKPWRRSYIVKGMTFLPEKAPGTRLHSSKIFKRGIRDDFPRSVRPELQTWNSNFSTYLTETSSIHSKPSPPTYSKIPGKNPTGENDTFKILLFFSGNGCSPEVIAKWILTSQHWASHTKGEKIERQFDFIVQNLSS